MLRFSATGLDKNGQPFVRDVSAESAAAATEALRAEGCQVSALAPVPAVPNASEPPQPPPRGRLKSDELVGFCTHLAGATRVGLPLPGALRCLAVECARPAFRGRVEALAAAVESGQGLAAALEADGGFPPFLRRAITAGERTGTLSPVLLLLAGHLRLMAEIGRKTVEMLIYPGILVGTLIVILVFYQSMAEQVRNIHQEFGRQMPLLTKLLLEAGAHASWVAAALAALTVAAVLAVRAAKRSAAIGSRVDRWAIRMPVIGPLLRTALVCRFSHLSALLIRAGVPTPAALHLVADTIGNRVASDSVAEVARIVEAGGKVTDGARGSDFLPPTLVWMLSAGEARGELAETLEEAAELYHTTFRHQVALLENLIGPLIVILTGVTVLSILLVAMIAPLIGLLALMR